MSENSILILGATSDIAQAIAHCFASEGYNIQLTARDSGLINDVRRKLKEKYGDKINSYNLDVLKPDTYNDFINNLDVLPNVVVCAMGYMGNQIESEKNLNKACLVMRSNYEGPVSIISVFANAFILRGSGTIIGISSVAGIRGRASNYFYGSAKAGFISFLSGLRSRLKKHNVHVITVLSGFVQTKMTTDLNLPRWLTA